MPQTTIQPSFAAGELSPSLFGRTDLAKYHSGLALARNCFVDYRGGITSRPGQELVGFAPNANDHPVLIPFIPSVTDAYVILAGNLYFQFAQDGEFVTIGGGTGQGQVASVTVSDAGGNYTAPNVVLSGGGGVGATAVAVLGGVGPIQSATVTAPGSGYTNPTVTLVGGGGTGATATAQLGGLTGGVVGVTFAGNFRGEYPTSNVTVAFVGGGGSGATGIVAMTFSSIENAWNINYVEITNPGSGYTSPPTVVLSPNPGAPFAASPTAVMSGNQIASITITDGGVNYTSAPTVVISDPSGTGAAAKASLPAGHSIVAINITNAGANYLTPPTVQINDSTGSGATAVAALAGLPTPGDIVTVTTPYATSELQDLRWAQSADVLSLYHPNHPPMQLVQSGPTSFALSPVVTGPVIQPPGPINGEGVIATANDGVYSYVITAVSTGLIPEESISSFQLNVLGDDPAHLTTTGHIRLTWTPPPQPVAYYKIYKAVGPTRAARNSTGAPVNTICGLIGQSFDPSYYDIAGVPDFSQTPPQYQDPISPGQIANVVVSATGAGTYSTQWVVALVFTGGGGTGASGFAIIDPSTAGVVGVVIQNYGKGYTSPPVITDGVAGGATYSCTLGPLTGTYPVCGNFYQERNLFGGTPNFPSSFVASQPGLFNNFNVSIISEASDALTVNIVGRANNFIQSLTPLPTGLMVFTSGGAFLVSGGNGQAAITPDNVVAYPQASSAGSNFLQPLSVNMDLIYCQAVGAVVRSMTFNFYYQSYTGTDRSFYASHLFLAHQLLSWCYAEEPFRLVYAVRDDGALLVMTYVPEQEVIAWTHYDTAGAYLSVTSIPENQEDAVYVLVQREFSFGYQLCLERFTTKIFQRIEDAFCLDAAIHSSQNTFPFDIFVRPNQVGQAATIRAGVNSAGIQGDWIAAGVQIGNTIWGPQQGKATVLSVSDTLLEATINEPFFDVSAQNLFGAQGQQIQEIFINAGSWVLCVPTGTIIVPAQFALNPIWVFADGMPVEMPENYTVPLDGVVVLPNGLTASKLLVGWPYQVQVATLPLDMGEPTIQGKRKTLAAVTTRFANYSNGLKVGRSFSSSDLIPLRLPDSSMSPTYSSPPPLYDGDIFTPLQGAWDTEGQVCYQMDYPLPFDILAIISELVVGDTGR